MKQYLLVILFAVTVFSPFSGCTGVKEVTLEEIPIDLSLVQEDFSIQELKDMNGENFKVYYHQNIKLPDHIVGAFTTRKILTPENAVYALMSVRSIMQIENTSFACTGVKENAQEQKEFSLQQLYKGIAVEFGDFTIVVSKEGTPISLSGHYRSGIDLDVVPQLSGEKAREFVTLAGKTKITECQLVVFPYDKSYYLAWKFLVRGQDFDKWKDFYIDAATGRILDARACLIS